MQTKTNARARALRLSNKATSPETLNPELIEIDQPQALAGEAVIEVLAAAVNQSDVKAALGMMPHAIWPRTPGRDFAGVVVAGPRDWMGQEVWGTGGDLGITRDGSHSRYLVLPVDALSSKPAKVSVAAAATVGVPFVTAYEGLRRAGLSGTGQTVVVFGVNGKVGQAAAQLASRAGARVVGVDRGATRYLGHSTGHVETFDGTRADLAQALLDVTAGRGADIAYNAVGSPYFSAAIESLAVNGVQILISTIERQVPFDILGFYRRNLQMLGVDSLKLTVTQCAQILNLLLPGFDDGTLVAFEADGSRLLSLDDAPAAYRRVLEGSLDRIVLVP